MKERLFVGNESGGGSAPRSIALAHGQSQTTCADLHVQIYRKYSNSMSPNNQEHSETKSVHVFRSLNTWLKTLRNGPTHQIPREYRRRRERRSWAVGSQPRTSTKAMTCPVPGSGGSLSPQRRSTHTRS